MEFVFFSHPKLNIKQRYPISVQVEQKVSTIVFKKHTQNSFFSN